MLNGHRVNNPVAASVSRVRVACTPRNGSLLLLLLRPPLSRPGDPLPAFRVIAGREPRALAEEEARAAKIGGGEQRERRTEVEGPGGELREQNGERLKRGDDDDDDAVQGRRKREVWESFHAPASTSLRVITRSEGSRVSCSVAMAALSPPRLPTSQARVHKRRRNTLVSTARPFYFRVSIAHRHRRRYTGLSIIRVIPFDPGPAVFIADRYVSILGLPVGASC